MIISEAQQNRQLDYLYRLLQGSLKTRTTIKGWCITVWSAVAIIILARWDSLSEQNQINEFLLLVAVLTVPLFLFWIFDSVERAREYFYKKQMEKIEKDIFNGVDYIKSAGELFVMSAYGNITMWEKFKCCLKSSICSETIFSFYPVLIAASLIFVGLIQRII